MTSQTFGFYVGIVYIQKGIELLLLEFEPLPLNNATGWLSVTIAILFTVSVYLVTAIGKTSFLPFKMRYLVSSFAFAAGCIFWTGFSHFPKNSLERVPIERLPITKSFFPSIDRSWFIDFWNIEAKWAFVGAPLGFLIMLLFYFDHNVSSVMAQARQFPVKRPAGFHWDFFLLGITTLVSGFLGLPAPNGLVPQCPWSTEALSVYEQVEIPQKDEEGKSLMGKKEKMYQRHHIVITRVVENRLGHLLVGLLTLGTMTRPLLVVLGTMPRAIFAGIFLLVGWSSIEGNIITTRTLAIFKDRHLANQDDGLFRLKRSKIALFVGIQWLFFAMTIAISQTIAAIGFPVIITLLIPFRYFVVPKWFTPDELRILDSATADADGVLASIGQETEAVTGQGQRVARDTGIAGTEWSNEEDNDDDGDDNYPEYSAHQTEKPEKGLQSEVPGYVIRDEDQDEAQYDENMVKATDKIALMADLGGGGSAGDAGEGPSLATPFSSTGSAAAPPPPPAILNDAATTSAQKSSISSSPSKNNKRTKSATQSWWGLGGSKAVERAPSPHTPNTPTVSGTPDIIPMEAAKLRVDMSKEEETDASGTTGLKKFFSSKRKEVSGLYEEETQQSSTVDTPVQQDLTLQERKEAIDEHFASHFGATRVEASPDKSDMVALPPSAETPSAADKLDAKHSSIADAAAGIAAGGTVESTVEESTGGTEDRNMLEKAVDRIESALGISSTDDEAQPQPIADTTIREADDKPAQKVEEVAPATSAAAVTTPRTANMKSTADDDKTKQRAEASAAAVAAGAETQRIADEYKRREKEAREARVAEKKAKEDEKRRAKEEKVAAKKRAKEDAQKKKDEAALAKKKEKEAAEKKKQEVKDQKNRQERERGEQKRLANEEQKRKEAATAAAVAAAAMAKKEADAARKQNEKEAEDNKRLEEQSKALEAEQSKKKEEAEAAVLALSTQKSALETDLAAMQGGKEKILSDFEAQEKARKEKQAKKKAEEEAALASISKDKAELQDDVAELQAKKEKELKELEESRTAKEKEHSDKTAEEEAALAALVASKEAASSDLTKAKESKDEELARLEQEKETKAKEVAELQQKQKALEAEKEAKEKEIAEKREAEAAALALLIANKKSAEEEIAKRKAQEEKEAVERKEKEDEALAEAERKRQALQAEIAELEAKAKISRNFLAPAKVSKSSLGSLNDQVAGHEASIYTVAGGALVVKSCSPSESGFYQNALIHQDAVTSKSQQELITRLKKYLPTYHGTVQLISDTDESTEKGEDFAVVLENLTRGYKHANVLDIKLGKQLWDDTASEEKKKRLDEVAKTSTSAEVGLRLTGWQIWDNEKNDLMKVGKAFGKAAKVVQLPLGLQSFFGLATKEEAAQISNIAGEQVSAVVLPEKSVERIIQDGVIPAMKEIIEIVKKLEWRIRGSSLLIVFEGDKNELNKINAKSDLEAGRGLIDTDQLVDTTNLNNATILKANSSRLVDVRLIDFAHASFGKEKGADEGYLSGLQTTKELLEELSKALRKGTLHQTDTSQSDNILKTSGGAALIGSITGLFSREKSDTEPKAASIKGKDKEALTPAPALPAKLTETVVRPNNDISNNQINAAKVDKPKTSRVEEAGAVGAGAGVGVAAIALEKKNKSKENVKPRQSSLIADTPSIKQAAPKEKKVPVVTPKKDRTSKQGGFLSLFSARLVDNDDKKTTESITPKEEKIVSKMTSSEKVAIETPKKEEAAAVPAVAASIKTTLSKETKGKGKAKESEEKDKKAEPFWQVKDESEKPQEVVTTSPTKSASGKRVMVRHTNPVRGGGKPPPAIQFRDPLI